MSIRPGEIVGLYSRLEAAVVVIAFEARVVGGEPPTEPGSARDPAFAPADIPWPEVAFLTSKWAIRDWIRLRRPDAAGRRRPACRADRPADRLSAIARTRGRHSVAFRAGTP